MFKLFGQHKSPMITNSNLPSSSPTLAQLIEKGVKLTPMMEQFWSVKKIYPENLLLFRMGDFYELFFEDAQKASTLLNISLTTRGKLGEAPIPMAGIPHHSAHNYIDRLTQLGLKVIICDQLENPAEAKGIVKRGVTQVVSPSLPYDLDRSPQQDHRYIACAFQNHHILSKTEKNSPLKKETFLVLLDFTTGDFLGFVFETEAQFLEALMRYQPKEFLCTLGQWDHLQELKHLLSEQQTLLTHLSEDILELNQSKVYIEKLFPYFQKDTILAQNQGFYPCLSAVSWYVCQTQNLSTIHHIRPFKILNTQSHMKVSWSTLRGLEIFPRHPDQWKDSLIGFMDKTCSSLGARTLKHFFQHPLRDLTQIKKRQSLIHTLMKSDSLLRQWREWLKDVRDLDRILAKATLQKNNSSDLLNLAQTLQVFLHIQNSLTGDLSLHLPALSASEIEKLQKLKDSISLKINSELGANAAKGNLLNPGWHQERDYLYELSHSSHQALLALESRYREETGIGNLKVKSNNINGFFIEISNSHLNKVPPHFKRRQTLTNGERFITQDLLNLEKEVLSAEHKLAKLEKQLFEEIISEINELSKTLLEVSKRLGQIDVFQSFAWVALQEQFSCPEFTPTPMLNIQGAWHPLIKAKISDRFVAHNISLIAPHTFALITGPNMAGKTTVMREIAIIQYLAQLGSFIPAKAAQLGLCDYLFSRLGASDDILRGQSTFMVEMTEAAEIVRHATEKSLVILDEIGRGTSTYDGLSIAWALTEHLAHEKKCLTFFATHYHELIKLAESLPMAKNYTVNVHVEKDRVDFLYDLLEEGATQSFGIHVAKLAGLPSSLIQRSQQLLNDFECSKESHPLSALPVHTSTQSGGAFTQLSLFEETERSELEKIKAHLLGLNLNETTPLKALQQLQEWQNTFH